jgi:hypothetical protein
MEAVPKLLYRSMYVCGVSCGVVLAKDVRALSLQTILRGAKDSTVSPYRIIVTRRVGWMNRQLWL